MILLIFFFLSSAVVSCVCFRLCLVSVSDRGWEFFKLLWYCPNVSLLEINKTSLFEKNMILLFFGFYENVEVSIFQHQAEVLKFLEIHTKVLELQSVAK